MPLNQTGAQALLLTMLALAACARSASQGSSAAPPAAVSADPRVATGIDQLRSATRAYQSLDAAVAAGYPRVSADCIIHEHHGAMGYHHLNRAYVDKVLDVNEPEMLLYQRMPDSSYKLNGVEFMVPYREWPRDSVAPVLMGQTLHREDNFKYWYLHVWAWTNNHDGLFANFNPDVTCPAGTGKVYKAFPEP